MKTSVLATVVAAVTAGAVGVAAPRASADNFPVREKFGANEQLVDGAGTIVTDWKVDDLKRSTDVVPWPVHGSLWEASASVRAERGTVTPIISDFNARADNGQTYEALAVPTPDGINPATLAQGGTSSGKLYFDVIGPPPDGVVYNAGGRDLLFWAR